MLRSSVSVARIGLRFKCSVRCLSVCPKVIQPVNRQFGAPSVAANHHVSTCLASSTLSGKPKENGNGGDDKSKEDRSGAGADEFASMTSSPPQTSSSEPQKTQETLFQRFKAMAKQYWYILIPVHLVTTVIWVGGFYLLAKSGLDLVAILDRLGAPEVLMKPVRNSNAGYYAVTYACYKLATPLRYVVTIGGTTVLVRYLTRFGYLKPMPNKKELMRIYSEGRDNFTRRQRAWRKRIDDLNWRLRVKENLKGKRKP